MSRLRLSLDAKVVNHLVKTLFTNTLVQIQKSKWEPLVITSEKEFAKELQDASVECYIDSGTSLNEAISLTVDSVSEKLLGLIMPDFPNLSRVEIQKFEHFSNLFPLILSPTADYGTAFAILPRDLWKFRFLGVSSFYKLFYHLEYRNIQVAVAVLHSLQYDLDTIQDYEYYFGTKEREGIKTEKDNLAESL